MGNMQAREMTGLADLDTALSWHLRSNHYPPVPHEMIKPAKEAIEAAKVDDAERIIAVPEAVATHRRFGQNVPAWAIIEAYHLEVFL